MKINIANLIKNEGTSLDININGFLPDIAEYVADFNFDEAVDFKGTLIKAGDILVLNGELTCSYEVKCYRCNQSVQRNLVVIINENILKAGNVVNQDEEPHYVYEDDILVLDKIFIDNIVLNLPMKELCSEACKGLCPICGKDLNIGPCNCKRDTINPAFSVLKDLLKENESNE